MTTNYHHKNNLLCITLNNFKHIFNSCFYVAIILKITLVLMFVLIVQIQIKSLIIEEAHGIFVMYKRKTLFYQK